MVRLLLCVACVACASCTYDPSFQDCAVRCTADIGCPENLTCGAEGLCREPGMTAACPDVTIAWRATTTQLIVGGSTVTAVTIDAPSAEPGDVLIATIAMGNVGEALSPAFAPPPGWAIVRQTNKDLDSALAVYWHMFGASEDTTYTWSFNQAMQGVAWISSYSGVSSSSPIDGEAGSLDGTPGTIYKLPTLPNMVPGEMIVGAYAGHDPLGDLTPATWTASAPTRSRANFNNGSTRSGLGLEELRDATDLTTAYTATASTTQAYALMHVLALRPAPAS
jgi:hypothetical protein